MSSIAMSAFATLGRTCLVPNTPGHRRWGGLHPRVPMRSGGGQTFQICRMNRQHVASIAVGLGIITLLLVIFAYHGGHGVGSWFYSLLVVVSGLAFVVFGPLLLCRFLMHAYYRQVEARSTIRLQADHGSQTNNSVAGNRPHVYACIIIAPEDITSGFGATSRLSNLPTYEEAVLHNCVSRINNNNNNVPKIESRCKISVTRLDNSNDAAQCSSIGAPSSSSSHWTRTTTTSEQIYRSDCPSNEVIKDDSPPPTYSEALTIIAQQQVLQQLQLQQTPLNEQQQLAATTAVSTVVVIDDEENDGADDGGNAKNEMAVVKSTTNYSV